MLATVAAVAAHPGRMGFHPFWPVFIIGPLIFILVVGLIVALVMRRRRWGYGPWGSAPWHGAAGAPGAPGGLGMHGPWAASAQSRSAEQILADRFAKGDIDETEYRARLEVLRANRPEA
ncbi:SHOCT domain-containing protein [Microbacterium panaciterrae]|uniref:SHOCT domain-containing protein n=1 Tax=Microbacterium panaciterrae TaxID=985759 RepID=A0ABP8P5Y6_9MICO